jgi:predicted ATPase/class 3 adenylate cyclase
MRCRNCETPNPQGATYCLNCGEPLNIRCPNCGTELPLAANFCFNCGFRLAGERSTAMENPPSPSRLAAARANLHPYVPSELLEKLDAARARGSMVGERRVVTMLFCDVQGSTAAAEQLDPEEWSEIMNGAFEHLIAPVYRYEGTVARLMGDGILAFFGAPIAHEDDPERAVLAGLAIVRGIHSYSKTVQQRWGLDFGVRVGINTGLVVVGEVGSDLRMEYTAMGDAINLAARMESSALPGTVQITADSYRLIAPLFDVWEVGGIDVKGKTQPVTAYRVLGPRPERGRVRGIEGLDTPLVGRDAELDSLRRSVERLRSGHGQIVCLIGEAGLGKSRLIQVLRDEWIATLPPSRSGGGWNRWIEMGAASYDTSRPYGMLKHQIRQFAAVHPSDPRQLVREKLARTLEVFPDPERSRMLDTYLALLGVQTGESDGVVLGGEAFKRELFAATLEATRAQAAERPTVYVIDDLHWADPATVELLDHVLQLVVTHPILFLFATRPYRRTPGWRITETAAAQYADCYTELLLQPLTASEGNALVDALLAVDDLPGRLRELILTKAEGNPFFVEEVVRTFIDRGILEQDRSDGAALWRVTVDGLAQQLTIPDTVQALLVARIDQLEERAQHTLQLAAVIGRTFQYRVLQDVSPEPAELDRHLNTLRSMDLIFQLREAPEPEYSFRHTLTQEAAYNSILIKRRRKFHRWVGEAMERLHADNPVEHAAVLAYHFDAARDDKRGLRYSTMAGDAAARLYANTEAAEQYGRAIEIAKRMELPGEQLVALYDCRGRVLEMSGRYDDALSNYRQLEAFGREHGDRALELAALIPQATLHSTFTVKFDPPRGRTLSERALRLARELDDPQAQAKIYWNLMLLEIYTDGDPRQAVEYGERSLGIAREHELLEEQAYALHDLTRAYAANGQRRKALEALEEAAQRWRHLGNLPMLADNLATAAGAYSYIGDYERALQVGGEALSLSREIGSAWGQAYSLIMVAPVYLDRGEMGRAISAWEEGLRLAQQANFAGPLVFSRADLAQAYGLMGDLDRAFELAYQALDRADGLETLQMRPYAEAALAWLHLQRGDLDAANQALDHIRLESTTLNSELVFRAAAATIEAEVALVNQDYERALVIAERTLANMRASQLYPFLADILLQRGRALRRLGRTDDAREAMAEARAEAEALPARRVLWRILAAMASVAAEDGDAEREKVLYREAREIVAFIADHAGTAELRACFLSRPDVRAVLEKIGGSGSTV